MTLQAYAISAIAHWDWVEAWPKLFVFLRQALTSGDSNLVHGAMSVLSGTFCVFSSFKFHISSHSTCIVCIVILKRYTCSVSICLGWLESES